MRKSIYNPPFAACSSILGLHRAFWNRQGLLLHTKAYVPKQTATIPIANLGVATEDIYLEPEMLNPENFLDSKHNLRLSEGKDMQLDLEGDAIKIRSAIKLPWMEGIMGCPIKLIPVSGAAWAERFITKLDDIKQFELRPKNNWLAKLVEFTRIFAERNDGSYLVSQATMRGPIDMADAMLGTKELFLAIMDTPIKIKAILETCTKTWIETAISQFSVIPPLKGGYVCRYGIWAPGQVIRMQTDASAMLSPELYKELIWPFDMQIIDAFEYSIMHTHSKYLQHIDNYLKHRALSAIQIGLDEPPFGPPVADLIPSMKKVLREKSLIVHGVATKEEADMLANELPHQGLMLDLLIR